MSIIYHHQDLFFEERWDMTRSPSFVFAYSPALSPCFLPLSALVSLSPHLSCPSLSQLISSDLPYRAGLALIVQTLEMEYKIWAAYSTVLSQSVYLSYQGNLSPQLRASSYHSRRPIGELSKRTSTLDGEIGAGKSQVVTAVFCSLISLNSYWLEGGNTRIMSMIVIDFW